MLSNQTPRDLREPLYSREQVEAVLDGVRPLLHRHGGEVDLVCVEGCDVHIALRGACSGCPSSTQTLRFAIEQRLREELAGFGELIAAEAVARAEQRRSWWRSLVGD